MSRLQMAGILVFELVYLKLMYIYIMSNNDFIRERVVVTQLQHCRVETRLDALTV